MTRAQSFLERTVPVVERLQTASNLAYWDVATTGSETAQEKYAALQSELREFMADKEAFAELKSLLASAEDLDPITRRQLELLHSQYLPNQISPEAIREIVRRETEIESLFTNFRATLGGRKVSNNEISQVLRDEKDSNLREEAWTASKQIGAQAAPRVVELVELRNAAARSLGYRDYYSLSLAAGELDEVELFETLDQLKELTDAPFREVKSALDERLATRFGVPVAELRPWHYADPFFQESPKSEVDLDRYFADQDVVELVRRHFEGLGLDIRDIIARSDLFEREGKDQHAFCTDIDQRGDVRVLANIRPNATWAGTLMHEMGHAVYSKHHAPTLPYLLRTHAHILTTEAVAMLMGRLVEDADWLRQVRGLDPDTASSLAKAARAELRLGELIFVRWGLVVVYFEREMYRNPRQDLNRLWREKVESLQLLSYPPGREAPDWAAKIHLAAYPAYYQNYLLGTLVASQFRSAVEKLAGQGALVADPRAGDFFIEQVFAPGARYPWNELLTLATGEPLNPRHFVDEFVSPR